MRYNQLMESAPRSVRDLNLPTDFWNSNVVDLYSQNLDSLDGCPDSVLGDFLLWRNNLTSLEQAPTTIGGSFSCSSNYLTSLKYSPKTVGGYFNCAINKLTSLVGCPDKVGGSFDCGGNRLTSLAGGPRIVGGDFDCRNNRLTSLAHAPEIMGGHCYFWNNSLTSLAGIHTHVQQMNGILKIDGNPITSHILGILLIQGCQRVNFDSNGDKTTKLLQQAVEILNKYLTQGRAGIMDCQAEMLAAGLDDFAQI